MGEQLWWAIGTVLFTTGAAWGTSKAVVKALEDRVEAQGGRIGKVEAKNDSLATELQQFRLAWSDARREDIEMRAKERHDLRNNLNEVLFPMGIELNKIGQSTARLEERVEHLARR
jgi:hypothetical protein